MCNQKVIASAILVLMWQGGVRAQSLADVAAAEAARRKAQSAPSKVYTNETLPRQVEPAGVAAPSSASTSEPAKADAASPPAAKPKPEPVDETKTEAYWKGRITSVQQGLARNKVLMDAMQSRINGLTSEALNIDDPGRRAAVQGNLTSATAELQRLKQESEKHQQQLVAIQEEARRTNVPPGWLR
jgi:hypothetical protein